MAQFEIIAEGLEFPEGPIAMPDGSLLLVEIKSGYLTRISPGGKVERIVHIGGGPNGAAIGPDGHCYICNDGGFSWEDVPGVGVVPVGIAKDYSGGRIERVNLSTGTVERLYDATPYGPLRSPNDIVFDAHGGFWFTDLGRFDPGSDAMDWGAIYYAKPDGSSISRAIFPMIQPNGIGLSPDGGLLYVAETGTGRLWEFPITAPGVVGRGCENTPHGGLMIYSGNRFEGLDSLAVDSAGNICVAAPLVGGGLGGIAVVSPPTYSHSFIEISSTLPTNICFGGDDLKKAYVTVSGSGHLIVMDWPRAGLKLNF